MQMGSALGSEILPNSEILASVSNSITNRTKTVRQRDYLGRL